MYTKIETNDEGDISMNRAGKSHNYHLCIFVISIQFCFKKRRLLIKSFWQRHKKNLAVLALHRTNWIVLMYKKFWEVG